MLVDRPPAGPGWVHEVKGDGYRLLARNEGQRVTLCTRYGTKFTDRLPRIAEAVRGLPADQALVDGEAVVFRRDGLSDSEAIGTKAGAATAAYIAFDLLQLYGRDIRQQRLEDRRAELERIVSGVDAILFCEAIAAEGPIVFAKACGWAARGSSQSASAASIGGAVAGTGRRRGIRRSKGGERTGASSDGRGSPASASGGCATRPFGDACGRYAIVVRFSSGKSGHRMCVGLRVTN